MHDFIFDSETSFLLLSYQVYEMSEANVRKSHLGAMSIKIVSCIGHSNKFYKGRCCLHNSLSQCVLLTGREERKGWFQKVTAGKLTTPERSAWLKWDRNVGEVWKGRVVKKMRFVIQRKEQRIWVTNFILLAQLVVQSLWILLF